MTQGGAWKVVTRRIDDNLNQQPSRYCIGNRDFVNVAPLQLREEIARIHPSSIGR